MGREEPSPASVPLTTLKVRSALAGDEEARAWIVVRFSPPLLAQARYRMRARLLRYCDAEDVVADTWQRALPKLGDFQLDDRRVTPRFVKFLSEIVIRRVNELMRQSSRSPIAGAGANESSSADGTALESMRVDPGDSVWKALLTHEEVTRVLSRIEDLDPRDQEIIVLRKIEGLSSSDVAKRLDISTIVVDTRLSRALARLRASLKDSVFDELADDEA